MLPGPQKVILEPHGEGDLVWTDIRAGEAGSRNQRGPKTDAPERRP